MSRILNTSGARENSDEQQKTQSRDDQGMIITARNIHKKYQQGSNVLHILRGVDLDIHAGEVLALVGPSGAGKSTLLHILGGLDRPDEGDVILDGKNVYNINDAERARLRNLQVGFVFQFYHLLPEFTALENVALPQLITQGTGKQDAVNARAKELLSKVGLKERAAHRPHELSGGEQQRVAIARALINSPKIVFCDEPTGNLDSKSGEAIIDILLNLNKTGRQTLVIVTHDEKIAARSSRIIHIKDGKLES